ncbi:MAG: histidine kinase [Verrucomicrobiia bacterium]
MKAKLSKLPKQYLAALRTHLESGSKTRLQPAIRLGRQAVALGLETLDLAKIHEQALRTLISPGESSTSRDAIIKRANPFFAEAITPIEKTHRAVLKASLDINHLKQTLRQRTMQSSDAARQLNRVIVQRQAAEQTLKKGGKHRDMLLRKSRRLQKHLQHLTREILKAQEHGRQQFSRQLHDDIVQILLGINVRLSTLKEAAKANNRVLKKEIASTQRLLAQSIKTINRFTHEFGL